MKKIILFLLIAVLILVSFTFLAPEYYRIHISGKNYHQSVALFQDGNIEQGLEKLRYSLYVLRNDPARLRDAMAGLPRALLSAAENHPLSSAPVLSFTAEKRIEISCDERLAVFSMSLEETIPLLKKGQMDEARDALQLASRWKGNCELDEKQSARFEKFREVYERLSGAIFVESSIAEAATETAHPQPPPSPPGAGVLSRVGSLIEISKDISAGLKNKITSLLNRRKNQPRHKPESQNPPPAPKKKLPSPTNPQSAIRNPQPPAVEPAATAATVIKEEPKPPAPAPKAPAPAAAETSPPPRKETRKETELIKALRGDISGLGLKVLNLSFVQPDTLHLAYVSPKVRTPGFADELKSIFDITDKEIIFMEMNDDVPVMRIEVFSKGSRYEAGWDIKFADYRQYRLKKLSGDEFMSRWKELKE